MPKFFFDVADGEHLARDEEGDELASWQEAQERVAELLPDIANVDLTGDDHRVFAVQIRDETGQVGYKATLTFAVEWGRRWDAGQREIEKAPLRSGAEFDDDNHQLNARLGDSFRGSPP